MIGSMLYLNASRPDISFSVLEFVPAFELIIRNHT
jgi:hypothetical protein